MRFSNTLIIATLVCFGFIFSVQVSAQNANDCDITSAILQDDCIDTGSPEEIQNYEAYEYPGSMPTDCLPTECINLDDFTWGEIIQDYDNLPAGSSFFNGSISQTTLENDLTNDFNNGGDFPFDLDQVLGLVNFLDNEVDIAGLIDCLDFGCEYGLNDNFSAQLADLTLQDANDLLVQEGYPPITQQDLDSLQQVELNTQIEEYFFGVGNASTNPCGGSIKGEHDETKSPNMNGQGEEDVDVFSTAAVGIESIDQSKLVPSPASLDVLKNVNAGVNLFNGSASISEHLTTLQSNDISVPITLSYNSNGVKVNDMGTDLGNTWQLNAGGKISRVVNSLPDEYLGTVEGEGIGPVSSFNGCLALGGGILLGTQAQVVKLIWSCEVPNKIILRIKIVDLATIGVPITGYIALDIIFKVDIKYDPGYITYKENGIGYLNLNDPLLMEHVGLSDIAPLDLVNFMNLSKEDQEKILSVQNQNKTRDEIEFLQPKIAKWIKFWEATQDLFGIGKTEELNKVDTEPDEFFFDFGNYSGKFVFDQSGNIHTVPKQELKITPAYLDLGNDDKTIVKFTVETPDGMVYEFGSTVAGHEGVEFSQSIQYSLPNQFTYEDGSYNGFNRKHYGPAKVDLKVLPKKKWFFCWPAKEAYPSTYEHNFTIMPSPKYSSTWHLTKIYSNLTEESVHFEYNEIQDLRYYSSKSLKHTFPNFNLTVPAQQEESVFETYYKLFEQNDSPLNPLHTIGTNWKMGQASLVYSVNEQRFNKWKIQRIETDRNDILTFNYQQDRPDLFGDRLLTNITHTIGLNFNKGWSFTYVQTNNSVNIECDTENVTSPVYSADTGFKWNLGETRDLTILDHLTQNTFYIFVNIPVAFWIEHISKTYDNVKSLEEFGSLMEVKGLAEIDAFKLDDDLEENIYLAEHNRAFLSKIKEVDRQGGLHEILKLEYKEDGNQNPEYQYLSDIPKRFSFEQDEWGYYNTNPSMTLLPPLKYNPVDLVNGGIDQNTNFDVGNNPLIKHHFSFSDPLADIKNGHNTSMDIGKAQIGMVRKINFETGGYSKFTYEANKLWDNTTDGAGLRVSSYEINSDDLEDPISKITNYEYENPVVLTRPIRIKQNPSNNTLYGFENYVENSTAPFNQLEMLGSNYVGYLKVTEEFAGNGKIEHEYSYPTPNAPPNCQWEGFDNCLDNYPIYRLKSTVNRAILKPVAEDIETPVLVNDYLDPFPKKAIEYYKFGKEVKTRVYEEEFSTPVSETEIKYIYRNANGPNQITNLRSSLFSTMNPAAWWEEFAMNSMKAMVGYANLIYDAQNNDNNSPDIDWGFFQCDYVGLTLQLQNNFLDFEFMVPNQARYIEHIHYFTQEPIKIEQVLIEEKTTKLNYSGGGEENLIIEDNDYNSFDNYGDKFFRISWKRTDYIGGLANENRIQYFDYLSDLTEAESKCEIQAHDLFEQIGYGLPLRETLTENGTKIGGGITGYKLYNNKIVPLSNWTYVNGTLVCTGKFFAWHNSGMPYGFRQTQYGIYPDADDYQTMESVYNFQWNNNLQLTSKIVGNASGSFSQTYQFNNLKELEQSTDENGLSKFFTYDERGRLASQMNDFVSDGQQLTSLEYSFQPNKIISTTVFDDGTPPQSNTTEFNGLGMKQKVSRSDGAKLEEIKYDNQFRTKSSYIIGTGISTMGYLFSPLNLSNSSSDAVGNTFNTQYLGNDNITTDCYIINKITDPNGSLTTIYKDAFGRNIKEVGPITNDTYYEYDPFGRIEKITNAEGQEYLYTYNEAGLLETKSIPGQENLHIYWYDHKYRNIAYKDANNEYFVNQFDEFGREVVSYHVPGGLSLTANGQLIANGSLDSYYIPLNMLHATAYVPGKTWVSQVRERVLNSGAVSKYVYRQNNSFTSYGAPTSTTSVYPSGVQVISDNSYNSAGLLTSTQHDYVLSSTFTFEADYSYTFDDLLRAKQTILDPTNAPSTTISELSYSPYDQVSSEKLGLTSGGNALQTNRYYYDAAGKLIAINGPGNSECYEDVEFCLHSKDIIIDPSNPTCGNVTGVTIDGNLYDFDTLYDLVTDAQNIIDLLNEHLDNLGLYGQAGISYKQGAITKVNVSVENSDAILITLHFENCDVDLETSNCCNASGGQGGQGQNQTNENLALFMEEIRYDGLNIDRIQIMNGCANGKFRNEFTYDPMHRINSFTNTIFGDQINTGNYGASFQYDLIGNFKPNTSGALSRTGLYDNGSGLVPGNIDNLTYSYDTYGRLQTVTDGIQSGYEQGFPYSSSSYTYDDAGNLTTDSGKGLTFTNNLNNLPSRVEKTNDPTSYINFDITYSGEKIKKVVSQSGSSSIQEYYSGLELMDGSFHQFHFGNGRIVPSGENYVFQYIIKDHLGNTVVLFEDKNQDGEITSDDDPTTPPQDVEVLQRNFYYPFGMEMNGGWNNVTNPEVAYLYNGKERHDENDLSLYEFGFRTYYPEIGRWTQIDPYSSLAPDRNGYRSCFNNPISFVDPDGLFEDKDQARAYAKSKKIKTGWFRRNKIVTNKDGSVSIENKKENTFTQMIFDGEGNEDGVILDGSLNLVGKKSNAWTRGISLNLVFGGGLGIEFGRAQDNFSNRGWYFRVSEDLGFSLGIGFESQNISSDNNSITLDDLKGQDVEYSIDLGPIGLLFGGDQGTKRDLGPKAFSNFGQEYFIGGFSISKPENNWKYNPKIRMGGTISFGETWFLNKQNKK